MIKKTIWSTERKDLKSDNPNHNKITVTEIHPTTGRRILVLSCYRSQADPSPIFISNLEHILQSGCQDNINEFLVLGDFNYREIKWIDEIDTSLPAHCREFLSVTNIFGLNQLNHNPSTNDENILDLVLTNLPDPCTKVLANTYPFTSDHFLLEFHVAIHIKKLKNKPRTTYNFKRTNFNDINSTI